MNILCAAKGPEDEIKKYIKLIENPEMELSLAMKFKMTDIVIEVFFFFDLVINYIF